MPDDRFAGPVKRSITIAGHQTSISLEPLFWEALQANAAQLSLPLNALVARIDSWRIEAANPPNLASAIRLWLYEQAMDGAMTQGFDADEATGDGG